MPEMSIQKTGVREELTLIFELAYIRNNCSLTRFFSDLLIKSLLALGVKNEDIGKTITNSKAA